MTEHGLFPRGSLVTPPDATSSLSLSLPFPSLSPPLPRPPVPVPPSCRKPVCLSNVISVSGSVRVSECQIVSVILTAWAVALSMSLSLAKTQNL